MQSSLAESSEAPQLDLKHLTRCHDISAIPFAVLVQVRCILHERTDTNGRKINKGHSKRAHALNFQLQGDCSRGDIIFSCRHFFEDAVGRAVPRPPRMVRKHEPCRDCTHMLVLDFLEHLKTLPWYEGQVRLTLRL